MKKLFLVLAGILLFIYALLALLSFRSDYCAQQELWGINRKLAFIAAHQESTPDFAFNQLAGTYRAFGRKYYASIYAKSAQLMIGNLYSLRKNYTQARLEFQKAVGPDKELSAKARLAIAKTYELEGRTDKALDIYRGIIKDYPLTDSGFYVPLYLTRQRAVSGNQKVYTVDDALAFYQKIAAKNPKSKFEYNALKMVALCQLNQKDWSGTVNTMQEIMLKYPVVKVIQQSVYGINLLCVTKLHDYDRGISIYSQFIKKYPNHLADPVLKNMIKDFQLLKSKNLIIQSTPVPAIK